MEIISTKILGIPYGQQNKNKHASQKWTEAVIAKTENLGKITKPCTLHVTFYLPQNKYPKDYPHGSDLDNILKRFFDALNETIFSEIEGKDSCVIELKAKKEPVSSTSDAGALLKVFTINI